MTDPRTTSALRLPGGGAVSDATMTASSPEVRDADVSAGSSAPRTSEVRGPKGAVMAALKLAAHAGESSEATAASSGKQPDAAAKRVRECEKSSTCDQLAAIFSRLPILTGLRGSCTNQYPTGHPCAKGLCQTSVERKRRNPRRRFERARRRSTLDVRRGIFAQASDHFRGPASSSCSWERLEISVGG